MKQNKVPSPVIPKEILSDLRESLWNYSNQYTINDDNYHYSGTIDKFLNMAKEAILNKEYKKALTYYEHANKYMNKSNLNFKGQINFLNDILDIISNNRNELIIILKYQKKRALNDDIDLFLNLERYLINLHGISSKEILLEVNELIECKKHKLVSRLLVDLECQGSLKDKQVVIDYLRAKNIEYSLKDCLTADDKLLIERRIQKIRNMLKSKNYKGAVKIAINSLNSMNYPIFYYYLGKAYFKMKHYEDACNCFLEYKKLDTKKHFTSNIYLYLLHKYKLKNQRNHANKYINEINEICSCLNINDFVPDVNNYAMDEFEHYDKKPYKMLRKIKMCEEDFLKRD